MEYMCALLAVEDVRVSRNFYQELLGLKVVQDYGSNILFEGGLALQENFEKLTGLEPRRFQAPVCSMELVFEEEDFEGFLAQLRKGVWGMPFWIQEQRWGQRTVRFYDPDEHLIEVGEPMKRVAERFLKQGMSPLQVCRRMDISQQDLEWILSYSVGKGRKEHAD